MFVGPIKAGVTLLPTGGVGVNVVVDLVAKRAVLTLLETKSTCIAKVLDFSVYLKKGKSVSDTTIRVYRQEIKSRNASYGVHIGQHSQYGKQYRTVQFLQRVDSHVPQFGQVWLVWGFVLFGGPRRPVLGPAQTGSPNELDSQ
jgi:hypothetical protein